jgi:hypothetical protein
MLILLVALHLGSSGKGKNSKKLNHVKGKLSNRVNKKVHFSDCTGTSDSGNCLAAYNAAETAFSAASRKGKSASNLKALPDNAGPLIAEFEAECAATACEDNCADLLETLK